MAFIDWILPKEDKFFDMLAAQSANCLEAAKEFNAYIATYSDASKEKRKAGARRLKDIEHKGDELTHDIIDKLNSAFITPLDKEDIHQMAGLLDDITDFIYTAGEHLVLLDVEKADAHILKMGKINEKAVSELHGCIVDLRKLRSMKEQHIRIHSLENEADDVYHAALSELFQKSKDPVRIMKYREIYELLEDVADKCEDVANVVENIVVKHG